MSLFNRPAWAKQQLSDDEDENRSEANIFSHSHSYRDIVAEQERRKREKAERKKAKVERRSPSKHNIKDELNGEGTAKRRRITLEESEKLLDSVGLSSKLEQRSDDEAVSDGTPRRRSPRKQKQVGRPDTNSVQSPSHAEVVDLGGSSDEAETGDMSMTPGTNRTKPKPAAPVNEPKDDSDDEFAELARKARQQRQQTENRSSHTWNPGVASPSPDVDSTHNATHNRPPPPDPVIQLFVDSPLPDTNPLIVHRKLSQPTGAIRRAWCQKQGFSQDVTDGVFFIHRMRRVYDVTTCRSLGLQVDEYGSVTMRGAEGKEGVDKVHLEAVTEDVFKQMKERKERQAQVRSGELPADEAFDDHTPAPVVEESLIRLVLKAKGMADFKLKVKPSTSISKIASAYSKSNFGDATREVRLEFDGEPLDPGDMVKDTEIEDMNVVEVHMA